MKQILPIAILLLAAANAQDSPTISGTSAREDQERLDQLIREWQLQNDLSPWRRQILERQAAEDRRREFADKANRFVATWNKVMGDYARNGRFNVKEARSLSKAFRDLEGTGWPK
jgi:hypothetical protein